MTHVEAAQRVADHFGLDIDLVVGKGGSSVVAQPRRVLLVLWRRLGLTWEEIGTELGLASSSVYYRAQAIGDDDKAIARQIMEDADA